MKRRVSLLAACLILAPLCSRAEAPSEMEGMAMPGMDSGNVQDAAAPTDRRNPHAYADGYDFGPLPRPRFADEHNFGSLLVDRLEWVHTADTNAAIYDLQARYGRDYDGAVFKTEGEVDGGKLQGRTELLWGHAVAPFWDSQLGMRYDHGVDPGRGWLALGVQGLAPYWFEVNATAYLREGGRSALRLNGEYELLLSQRLILQPRLEVNFYNKSDVDRSLGAGLVDAAAGVRLRYEVRRELAPYMGVEWAAKHGGTAEFARAAGKGGHETRLVAGVRLWF